MLGYGAETVSDAVRYTEGLRLKMERMMREHTGKITSENMLTAEVAELYNDAKELIEEDGLTIKAAAEKVGLNEQTFRTRLRRERQQEQETAA